MAFDPHISRLSSGVRVDLTHYLLDAKEDATGWRGGAKDERCRIYSV